MVHPRTSSVSTGLLERSPPMVSLTESTPVQWLRLQPPPPGCGAGFRGRTALISATIRAIYLHCCRLRLVSGLLVVSRSLKVEYETHDQSLPPFVRGMLFHISAQELNNSHMTLRILCKSACLAVSRFVPLHVQGFKPFELDELDNRPRK